MAERKPYWELLRDPRWQKKRLEVMEQAGFECEQCDDSSTTLNVHHTYYEKGLMPWEYPAETLRCLCEPCHKEAESLRNKANRVFGTLLPDELEQLIGFAKAIRMAERATDERPENYPQLLGMLRFVEGGSKEIEADLISQMPDEGTIDFTFLHEVVWGPKGVASNG